MFHFHDHPEWWAAVAREREIRETAYLGLPTPIAGGALSLAPLTLRQQNLLFADQNPILCGGAVTEADAAAFLWLLSADYAPTDHGGRKVFYVRLGALNLAWSDVIPELMAFVSDAMLDAPRAGRRNESNAPGVCSTAGWVDLFASAYGWSREWILSSPVAALYQEAAVIDRNAQLARGKPAEIPAGRLVARVERQIVDASRAARRATAAQEVTL